MKNKIVYVTGSRGDLGSAITKHFEALGAVVPQTDIDVRDSVSIEKGIQEILNKHDRIDIWINNAGLSHNGLLAAEKDDTIESLLETNVAGVLKCSRAVLKTMIPLRSGVIINISSLAAIRPEIGQTVYAASKGAVEAATRSLAKEVAGKSIRVNAIAPGFLLSKMTNQLDEALKTKILKGIPLARMGTTHEIAELVAFLASDQAAYITGQIIRVDGGASM